MTNYVYIGTSIDGYIADANEGIEWLECVPNPEGSDLGFFEFISQVDAVVMGRNTYETVIGFGQGWTYPVPGIILSSTLDALPDEFSDQLHLFSGTTQEVISHAKSYGFNNLYIDGGLTVQQFLHEDLIDELIITELPILLGAGIPLFANNSFGGDGQHLQFELVAHEVLLDQLTKRHYRRKRD